MKGLRHHRHQGSSGGLSTSMQVVREEDDPGDSSYRLITVGDQIRREIDHRFHKSEVNATYVFPRIDSSPLSKPRGSIGPTGTMSLLVKVQSQKLRFSKLNRTLSVAKRPMKSAAKGNTKPFSPFPVSDFLSFPQIQDNKRPKPRSNSRLFPTKVLHRQKTAVRDLNDSVSVLHISSFDS